MSMASDAVSASPAACGRRDAGSHSPRASAPRSADIHLFESDGGHHLFVVNGSRLFDVEPELFARLGAAISTDQVGELLSRIGVAEPPLIDDVPLGAAADSCALARRRAKMQSRLHLLLCAAGGVRRRSQEHAA